MRFEKIVCDRCKSEMSHFEGRKIWLSGVGREGGYDLCNECYYDLFHWFFEPNKYVVEFNRKNKEGECRMTLKNQIMKLQTYKMYEGEDTVYVERDDVLKALEQQPCEDCISREAVLKIFDEACYIDDDWYVMREKIEKLPSVKQTRPKGKWIILDECANEGVYCSECHKTVFKLEFSHTMKWRNFKYCPNCGAEMQEVEV